jgi:signal peptidase complex subunit 3
MHSLLMRANAIFCYALVVLAVLVGCNIGTSYFIPTNPEVHFAVTSLQVFQRHPTLQNDVLSLTFDLKADLSSLFHWNTKQLFVYVAAEYATERNAVNQIVVWDDIIRREEDAILDYTDTRVEYYLVDQGHALRFTPLSLLINSIISAIPAITTC